MTVGQDGCTTCAIVNGLSYFGIYTTPDVFAKNPANYTRIGDPNGPGLVNWQAFQLPGGFKFVERVHVRDDAAIMAALKSPPQFVILNVDQRPGDAVGRHWVLATGKTIVGNDYRCDDSWYANKATACGVWRNVAGFAVFGR